MTKGAGRVSEVSARFTLDALPGKQMAIDLGLALADQHEVLGPARDVQPVHVHPADRARQRKDRMLRIKARAQQPAFLRRHRQERDRSNLTADGNRSYFGSYAAPQDVRYFSRNFSFSVRTRF